MFETLLRIKALIIMLLELAVFLHICSPEVVTYVENLEVTAITGDYDVASVIFSQLTIALALCAIVLVFLFRSRLRWR